MPFPKLPAKPTMTIYVYELPIGSRFLIGNRADPDGTGFQVEAYRIYIHPTGDIVIDMEGRPLNTNGIVNENAPRMIVVDPTIEADLCRQFEDR
jgi:hypothetical protein